ncbi:MAG: HNH endonuclease [Fusobacteriaceae bacterium]
MTKSEKIQYIFDNYDIREDGRIFNKFGNETGKSVDKNGYKKLGNIFGSNFSVHRLVAMKYNFIETYDDFDCHHKDGDKTNNSVSNLSWISKSDHSKLTREENDCSGEKNPNSKLTWDDVRYIRLNYVPRKNKKDLMEQFNIKKSMFEYIIARKYWKEE